MILSVKDLYKSYGKQKVLKGISFDIRDPRILALVGPNGSGKTTLLSVITNLLDADSGEVTVLGKTNKDPNIFRGISFMQDNTVLYDYLTGYDHLQFIASVHGLAKGKITETAERVGMDRYMHKRVGNYSLGMKQHLLLTMALVNDPKLLILDEPLNGLDPTSAIRVRELLLEINKQGTTILLSSHNLGEIDRVTSEILFLKDGQLMKEDISHHEKTYYYLTVSDLNGAEKILSELQVPTVLIQDKLQIEMEGAALYPMLEKLSDENIDIFDVEKRVLGSEDRYREIFGSDGS